VLPGEPSQPGPSLSRVASGPAGLSRGDAIGPSRAGPGRWSPAGEPVRPLSAAGPMRDEPARAGLAPPPPSPWASTVATSTRPAKYVWGDAGRVVAGRGTYCAVTAVSVWTDCCRTLPGLQSVGVLK